MIKLTIIYRIDYLRITWEPIQYSSDGRRVEKPALKEFKKCKYRNKTIIESV